MTDRAKDENGDARARRRRKEAAERL